MNAKTGQAVVKNSERWRPSEFDQWGAGEGVGRVLAVEGELVDVQWPAGRAWQHADEIVTIDGFVPFVQEATE